MAKTVLVLHYGRTGHTARVARKIVESIVEAGGTGDLMDIAEAYYEGVDWERYDAIVVGAAVLYGTYPKVVFNFLQKHKEQLDAKPNSFFNLSVVARTPAKATVEGNRYMQKFLELSPWQPKDLKVIAGKVDYPNWKWYDRMMIQLIMKITKGPTDPTTVIDYTDWDDVSAYGRHVLSLAG